jgi:hypothetical protein
MVLLVAGSLIRHPLPEAARWAVVAVVAAVVLLQERGVLRFRLPENRRLVPETVLRLGRHLGPLQFGVEMGTGVRTYLPSPVPYVCAVVVLLLAPPLAALCAGIGFGLGRGLMTVSHLRYGDDDGWSRQWQRHRPLLAGATWAAFAVALAAATLAG